MNPNEPKECAHDWEYFDEDDDILPGSYRICKTCEIKEEALWP